MKTSLTNDVESFKLFVSQFDKYILEKAMEWARKLYKAVLEHVDDLILKKRDLTLKVRHKRTAWYSTQLGKIEVKRRYYIDRFGKYHYLLDELSGMSKNRHTSPYVQQLALELASNMSFRRSAEVLGKTTPINLSHQTIKNFVTRTAKNYLKNANIEITHFINTGEIPEGTSKRAGFLMIEADGVMVPLQREKAKKAEAKIGISYEGWDKVGKDRYRTVNKMFYADVAAVDRFWAGFTLKLQRRYDLAGIDQFVLGGDGASWVKDGLNYFGGTFQLSRFHYNRELRRVLYNDFEAISLLKEACKRGDIATVNKILEARAQTARGEQARDIKRLNHYLSSNASGLKDYPDKSKNKNLRGTGAMEGNVDKLIARRMKNQGMSWTIAGMRNMICIRFLVLEGKLEQWLRQGTPKTSAPVIRRKKINRVIDKVIKQNYFDWFNMELPALKGPHASRFWVRQLKSRIEVRV